MKLFAFLIGVLMPNLGSIAFAGTDAFTYDFGGSGGSGSHYCLCAGPIRYGQNGEQIVYWLRRYDVFRGKADYQNLKKFPTENACEAEMEKHNACRSQACG